MLATSPSGAQSRDITYDSLVRSIWAPIDPGGGTRELLRAATLAANSHNTQPWQFSVSDRLITIRPDLARRCPAVDPDDHHLFASLGCAAENIVHAAAAMGLKAEPIVVSANEGRIDIALDPALVSSFRLAAAISERQCTRAAYDGRPVPTDHLRLIETAGQMQDVRCLLLTDAAKMGAVLDYVIQGNTAQMRDPAFMAELKAWIRFNDADAIEARDGLSARSSGQPSLPTWLARPLLPFVLTARSENDKHAKHIRSSAGVAVFYSAKSDRAHWVAAGRAYQRFALEATALGLKHAFINQPVEVPHLRSQFAAFLGIGDQRPDLVVRFGYGTAMPRSLRRPIDSVIVQA